MMMVMVMMTTMMMMTITKINTMIMMNTMVMPLFAKTLPHLNLFTEGLKY